MTDQAQTEKPKMTLDEAVQRIMAVTNASAEASGNSAHELLMTAFVQVDGATGAVIYIARLLGAIRGNFL